MGGPQPLHDAGRSRQTNPVVTGIGALILTAIVAFSFVAAGWFAGGEAANQGGPAVLVHDADGKVHRLPLTEDGQLRVSTSLGWNVITVEDGQAYVSESNCDGHDCMRQGRISEPGMQLICLPHQLWVEVSAGSDGTGHMDVDAAANGGGHADTGGDDSATSNSASASSSDSELNVDTTAR